MLKNKKIIIAGGSGFIGQEIARYFESENEIIILSRQLCNQKNNRNNFSSLSVQDLNKIRFVKYDGLKTGGWTKELNGADIIINLAGKTVNCRYSSKNKKKSLKAGSIQLK